MKPIMIIDFHTHIFPDEIRSQRKNFFSKEKEFKLLYNSPKSKLAGISEILDSMDENKIDKSVIFGFCWNSIETCKKNNDYIINAAIKHPNRFIGFCCVNPFTDGAYKEVERCLNAGGLLGVGELAFYESGISDDVIAKLEPIMEICAKKNFPVLIHTNEMIGHKYPGKSPITLTQIQSLLKKFPVNKIILAHWGGGIFFYYLLKKQFKDILKNVYFDTAASPFLYDSKIYEIACQIIGDKKILFGSDFPLISPAKYFKKINSQNLNKENIENICGDNALSLLNS